MHRTIYKITLVNQNYLWNITMLFIQDNAERSGITVWEQIKTGSPKSIWHHSNDWFFHQKTGTLTKEDRKKDIDKKEFPDLLSVWHLSTWNPISGNWKTSFFFFSSDLISVSTLLQQTHKISLLKWWNLTESPQIWFAHWKRVKNKLLLSKNWNFFDPNWNSLPF